eukprot:TRINITY_DN18866_c0_g1_i1.p1 TRINITY_DN18866_c0_g1~~TRINITY_DN18866_c0_g1_i1.p1  ORF type:complete len:336 (+),score=122.81 TRINITY_DN18866_c0_g1_i1:22-1029(+)
MVGVTWKGSRSRSFSSSGGPGGARAASQPPSQSQQQADLPPKPVITFKDKQSYQELFKPLPKPEPIPTLNVVQIDCKSWSQLQKEREDIVQREIVNTKREADSMFQRVQQDDRKRINLIEQERIRIETEQRKREEILAKEREERRQKDEARKQEIMRQEQILAKSQLRNMRSKTVDLVDQRRESIPGGGGIRVYHYKDEAVPQIVKETRQEEMLRKNSISFLVDTNASENGSDDINGQNGEIMHMNGVNGTMAHRNGAPEVNGMPPQPKLPVHKLPPRPAKDPMSAANNRQFQNGVDTAFIANGADPTSNGGGAGVVNGQIGNIYKSVMDGKGFY